MIGGRRVRHAEGDPDVCQMCVKRPTAADNLGTASRHERLYTRVAARRLAIAELRGCWSGRPRSPATALFLWGRGERGADRPGSPDVRR